MNQIAENFKKLFDKEDLFIQATPKQKEQLENLFGNKVDKITDFYSKYQPCDIPMTESYVQLLGIDNIILENTNAAPGQYLAEYGVFVFGLTAGGNVLCIDTNCAKNGDAGVYIADANFVFYNEMRNRMEMGTIPDDVAEQLADDEVLLLNYPNIARCLRKIEDSFMDFMLKLSNNEYEDMEEYLE